MSSKPHFQTKPHFKSECYSTCESANIISGCSVDYWCWSREAKTRKNSNDFLHFLTQIFKWRAHKPTALPPKGKLFSPEKVYSWWSLLLQNSPKGHLPSQLEPKCLESIFLSHHNLCIPKRSQISIYCQIGHDGDFSNVTIYLYSSFSIQAT